MSSQGQGLRAVPGASAPAAATASPGLVPRASSKSSCARACVTLDAWTGSRRRAFAPPRGSLQAFLAAEGRFLGLGHLHSSRACPGAPQGQGSPGLEEPPPPAALRPLARRCASSGRGRSAVRRVVLLSRSRSVLLRPSCPLAELEPWARRLPRPVPGAADPAPLPGARCSAVSLRRPAGTRLCPLPASPSLPPVRPSVQSMERASSAAWQRPSRSQGPDGQVRDFWCLLGLGTVLTDTVASLNSLRCPRPQPLLSPSRPLLHFGVQSTTVSTPLPPP